MIGHTSTCAPPATPIYSHCDVNVMFDVPFPIQITEVSHTMGVGAALLCQNNYL